MFSSFFKESGAKFSVPKSRNGRRSMRVSTLLEKDQAGSLLKHKLGGAQEDLIPGGVADAMESEQFDPGQLAKGTQVELEHTGDRALAEEIARDHLAEDPRYYEALEEMEASLEKDSFALSVIRHLAPAIKTAEEGSDLVGAEKSASRLRKAFQVVEQVEAPKGLMDTFGSEGFFGVGRKLLGGGPQKRTFNAMLNGENVGHLMTEGGKVTGSHLHDDIAGMGLGKKLYGEVMRRMPNQELRSDNVMTAASRRVWEGMKKRPGYSVSEPRGKRLEQAVANRVGMAPILNAAVGGDFTGGIRSQYSASLPLAAAVKTASSVDTVIQGLQDGQPLGNLTTLQSPHITKSKPGDTPSTEPVTRFPTITTGGFSPPQSKLAELGRMIMSPSEVYPTRGVEQPHRSRVRHDENVVISSHDPDPITPVQTYGAGERA